MTRAYTIEAEDLEQARQILESEWDHALSYDFIDSKIEYIYGPSTES